MRILLSNDDGVLSPGLLILVAVVGLTSQLVGCALPPFRPLSSSGLTLANKSLRLTPVSNRIDLVWPITPDARFTRGFRSGRSPHDGIDLAAPIGTPIYAAHKGKVLYSGDEFSGYGNVVIVESAQGWISLYSHCEELLVSEGEWVAKGQNIATVGDTGNARGAHLHFELRKGQRPVDPMLYFSRYVGRIPR